MKRRLGLQAKMTASYLLVTAAAVILVEVVVLGVVVPRLVSQAERPTLVPLTASGYANRAMLLAARLGRLPTDAELRLGDRAPRLGPGQARVAADGAGVAIPYTTTPQDDTKPMSLALLLTPDGRVVGSSYPARYRVGGRIGEPGMGALPARVATQPPPAWGKPDGLAPTPTLSGDVLWAAAPVVPR